MGREDRRICRRAPALLSSPLLPALLSLLLLLSPLASAQTAGGVAGAVASAFKSAANQAVKSATGQAVGSATGQTAGSAASQAVKAAVSAGVNATQQTQQRKPIVVSAQGASFCSIIVQTLSQCQDPNVPTDDTLNLQAFRGNWYVLGSNAQAAFSLFEQRGAQCMTTSIGAPVKIRGINAMTVSKTGLIFGNPLRMMESVVVSQFSAQAGLAIRYMCQFLMGEEPLTTVVPMLGSLNRTASRLTFFSDLQGKLDAQWTKSVRGVTNGNPIFTGLIDKAVTPQVQGVIGNFVSAKPTVQNPLTLGALSMLGNYASLGSTFLTQNTAMQFLGNSLIALVGESNLANNTQGRLGTFSYTVLGAAVTMSQLGEASFAAIERIQRWNLALSGGNWPDRAAPALYVESIYNETVRIQWIANRMQGERKKMLRAGYKLYLRLNTTTGQDPRLLQASQAIISLSGDKSPLATSVNLLTGAAGSIQRAVRAIGPGLQIPNRIKQKGVLYQSPVQPGNLTLDVNGRRSKYNVISLIGTAAEGYQAALVWGCSTSAETGFLPENEVYILSRTPEVSKRVIRAALGVLRSYNLVLGGHNVFLFQTQDAKRCSPLIAL